MTQAERVLSTPPTNTPIDTTRRGFLGGTAAAVAAGNAVNVAALATIRPAVAASAPILAAIEAHKAAFAALENVQQRCPSSKPSCTPTGGCSTNPERL